MDRMASSLLLCGEVKAWQHQLPGRPQPPPVSGPQDPEGLMLLGARGRVTSVPWHNPHSAIHLTEAMQIHTHCPGCHLPPNPRPRCSQSATDLG